MRVNPRKALAVLFLLGLAVSVYLVYVHFYPGALVCPTKGIINCGTVLTSSYSVIFGIPLAAYAFGWFVIALALVYSKKWNTITSLWMLLGIGGIAYSTLAMYKIGNICDWCSALDVIIALSVAVFFMGKP